MGQEITTGDAMTFKIGELVRTKKGCRIKGPFQGTVIGFSRWGSYKSVKVKKVITEQIVMCLEKNLVHV